MDHPTCPFCESVMTPRNTPGLEQYYQLYDCRQCHAELKKVLVRRPESGSAKAQSQETDCGDCAFSDFHCFSCDDTVCEKHIRTFEKYAEFFSKELGETLIRKYGNRIYCPLCFQSTTRRFSLEYNKPTPKKKSVFNFPLILGLLSLVLVIVFGVRKCAPDGIPLKAPENVQRTP